MNFKYSSTVTVTYKERKNKAFFRFCKIRYQRAMINSKDKIIKILWFKICVNLNNISWPKATKKTFLDRQRLSHHVALVREWSCFYVNICLKSLKWSKTMKINLNYNKLRNSLIIKPHNIFQKQWQPEPKWNWMSRTNGISPQTTQMANFFKH